MRALTSLRLSVFLAVVVFFAFGTAAQAQQIGRGRVLVKLKPNFARNVEASLPMQSMQLASGQTMDPSVQAFMQTYGGSRLRPVYPGIVRQKKTGLTDLQIASSIRQRFPARAQRFQGAFTPPQISRTYILDLAGPNADVNSLVSQLRRDPNVEYAEPDHVSSTNLTPNDPYFSSFGSWGQNYDDLWGVKKIGAPSAWDTATGSGIVVAVVDTGVDYNHPDIAGNIWRNTKEVAGNGIDDDGNGYIDDVMGWDFIGSTYQNPTQGNNPVDHFGHGTHVSGTIAAIGNNSLGVIGVAWQAQIMAVKGLDDSGFGLDSTLGPAIIYAANNGAEVISNSWGGPGSSQTIADAISYAYSLGAVVVAAAGNNSDDARNYYPANLPQVITVAATDHNDLSAYFSNWGSKIDVAAPGVDILSLRAAGTSMGTPVGPYYTRADGTSMATPHVSGLSALLLSEHPQYSNEDVRQAIRTSATDLNTPGFDLTYGYGRINASAAAALANVLEAKIQSPIDGTRIKSATAISGVASGNGFSQYVLEFGAGHLPSSWTTIQSGSVPVAGGTLGTFDPSTIPDGIYTIRLTAYDTSNRAFVDRIELIVDEVSITAPASPVVPSTATEYKTGVAINIIGTATGPSFQDFRLEWAEGINPSSGWATSGMNIAGAGLSPITNAQVGSWDTSSITKADYYTIRLSVDNSGFTSIATTLVYLEPSLLSSGWPQWLNQAPNFTSAIIPAMDSSSVWHLTLQNPRYGNTTLPAQFWNFSFDGYSRTITPLNWGNQFSPAAGDLDGNPGDEVIAGENNWLDNFTLNNTFSTLSPSVFANFQYSQAVLEDLDGDSQLETVALGTDFTTQMAHVFAWRRDGTQLNSNFPLTVQDQNLSLHYASGPRVLVGDIDGDGKREIVVEEGLSSSTFGLHLFANDGSQKLWSAPVFSGYPDKMALADLDHNGTLDVVLLCLCNSQKQLHVLQPDGTERPGWPVVLGNTSMSYLALGDLNRDGREEIVVSNNNAMYVLEPDGTSFSPAWPVKGGGFNGYGGVVLADVDGDGFPEIITVRNQYLTAPNPLLPASQSPVNGSTQLTITSQVAPDGSISMQPRVDVSAQAYSPNAYYQPQLIAMHSDGTIVRSWNLLGANGNQPEYLATLAVGDFNQDGIADIAANYFTISGGGVSGYLNEGVATVLTTGAPFNPSANDWPLFNQNARNTAVLLRDHTPPVVNITSPLPGAVILGVATLTASASDNVGVTRVQFQLDGSNLGPADTTAPFSTSWDTSTASYGNHTLTAQAWDAAGNVGTSAGVTITIQAPNSASMSPSALNFGNQLIGTTSAQQTVTVTNNGGGTLNISAVQLTGDFAQTSNCIGPLSVGATCSIQVTFTPTIRGIENGRMSLSANFTGSSPIVSLSGSGQAALGSFSPVSVNLGNQTLGTTSSASPIVFTNNGDVALTVTSVTVSGDFGQTSNCVGTIVVGATCTVQVTFTPTLRGPESGTLSLAANFTGNPPTASLSGTGQGPSATLTPGSVSFGGQNIGSTSSTSILTYTNNGDLPLSITGISVTGDFAQTNNCPANLAVSTSCTISVNFKPTLRGAESGTLTVAGTVNASANLSGTGLALLASFSPTSLNFGNQQAGTTSATQLVTVTNVGDAAFYINQWSNPGVYNVTNNCPTPIVVNTGCTFSVSFSPTAGSTYNGSLTLGGNFSGSPVSISLSGTGLATTGVLSLSSLSFGNQIVGTSSAVQATTLMNTGNTPLNIAAIQVTGDFSQTNSCPATLQPTFTCPINIQFRPTAAGPRTGSVSVSSNANPAIAPATLSGTGVAQSITGSLAPASLSFASQVVGTTSTSQTLTLTSTGNTALSISGIQASGDFSQTNNCPTTLSLGSSCSISVAFTPRASGPGNGSLSITSNANPAITPVALSGSGVDFSISATPGSVTVTAGKNAIYTTTVQALGGSFGPVSLTCSGVPSSSTCTLSPTSVTPGTGQASSTLTVTTTARKGSKGTPAGTYTLTISGSGSGLQHGTTVQLNVN